MADFFRSRENCEELCGGDLKNMKIVPSLLMWGGLGLSKSFL